MLPNASTNGILILDKPLGLTSNRCLQIVKRLLGSDKAGHTGALDPLASGVLPLCFGEATKVSQFLLDADKGYRAVIELGIATASGDKDGEVTRWEAVPDLALPELTAVLAGFVGAQFQEAPVYSALKQGGVPLYKLARAGQPVIPKIREIHIHTLDLLRWQKPFLEIRVNCSKGTYIRKLAEDIGIALGTVGCLAALRREKAGPFTLEQALTLERVEELLRVEPRQLIECLLPLDQALSHLPALQVSEEQTLHLRQGKRVTAGTDPITDGCLLRIYCGGIFIGLAENESGKLQPKRLLSY